VSPNSNPPSNIHVLIGRNGAGKTTVLKNISSAFLGLQSINTLNYSIPDDVNLFQKFATLSFVSFSAFDDFEFHEQGQEKKNFRYIGLKNRNGTNKTTEQITEEFCEFIKSCWNNSRGSRWEAILSHLNTDPIIARSEIISNICKNFLNQNECNETALLKIRKDFEKLSSGHKIILLTLTALVFITEQNSLVLFDEPESHLHPPLLSSFIRAVSALMTDRNAVAIMATHSPVVLQEVPKSCVSILTRVGKTQKLELPQIETFGENVGALTREVFKLELNQAGFYQLIEKAAKKEGSLEDLLQTFENQLGSEAKMVAMSAFRHQGNGVKND
jgi:predicted ATP-dependent endonuclease of OLD family